MKLVGAGLRRVGNKTPTGVPILSGKCVLDYGHFLDRCIRHRAFLRALVAFRVTKSCAVKPILGRQSLAAVNSRRKLAATEDGIPVRLHGHKPGLKLQQRFGQPNISPHGCGKIAIVGLADCVRNSRVICVDLFDPTLDGDRLGHGAHFELHVLPVGLPAAQDNSLRRRKLEAFLLHFDCVGA